MWNMRLQNRHYGHIDCPGHADYIKNMITGQELLIRMEKWEDILVCNYTKGII